MRSVPVGVQSAAVRRSLVTAIATALLLSTGALHAQDCGGELPPPAEPELEQCGTFNIPCKLRNESKRNEFEASSRTFSETTAVHTVDDEPTEYSIEQKVRGCRGETIVPELDRTAVGSVRYEILAPSGVVVASRDLAAGTAAVRGAPIRLPETGYYTLRLTSQSAAVAEEYCAKSGGFLKCDQWATRTVHSHEYALRFLGSAAAPTMAVGEQNDGTVTAQEPLARHLQVEAGSSARLVVRSIDGTPLRVRVQDERGILIDEERTGNYVTTLNSSDGATTYSIDVSLDSASAPTGITVALEHFAGAGGELRAGPPLEGEFASLPALFDAEGDTEHAALSRAMVAQWQIPTLSTGDHTLTLVPSGRAGLVLSVSVFNVETEEALAQNVIVSSRTTIPLEVPVVGAYVVDVVPLKATPAATNGVAKYTVELGTP